MVAPAFGAPGFHARCRTWSDTDIPSDLSGRTFVVTGANAGIGRATTEGLARRGATVVMACRSLDRARTAQGELSDVTDAPAERLPIVNVDLASLASVRDAAAEIADRWPALDGLIHNAGMLVDDRTRTEDGLESTLAVHVIGPYLMTELLAPTLAAADLGRLIFVSSGGMYGQSLDVEALEDASDDAPFDGVLAYARAKRAQVVLARGYADRLGPDVISVSMHPGWADTAGVRTALPRFHRLTRRWLRTPDQGADTVVWLAGTAPAHLESGRLYFDRLPRTEHLPGMPTSSSEDEERALWAMCARLAS